MPELDLLDWFIFLATGASAGLAAGYLGIGGGIVIVPALSVYLQAKFPDLTVPTQIAVATSLASILVTGSAAVITHYRRGALQLQWLKIMAPGLFIGAIIGVVIADHISSQVLLYIFLIFALFSGLRMISGSSATYIIQRTNKIVIGFCGLFIGAFSSLLGIGGGTLTVPLLSALKLSIHRAVAIASAAGVVLAVSGTGTFVVTGLNTPNLPAGTLGYVYIPAFLGIIAASVITAPLGARLVHKSRPGLIKRLFGISLILVAVRLFLQNL